MKLRNSFQHTPNKEHSYNDNELSESDEQFSTELDLKSMGFNVEMFEHTLVSFKDTQNSLKMLIKS
jgi:hypothetical protein